MATGRNELRLRPHASAIRTLIYIAFGPLIWALHLTAVYGAHALLCARGIAPAVALAVVLGVTAVALVLLASAIAVPRSARWIVRIGAEDGGDGGFHDRLMRLLAALSAFGVAWAGAAAVIVPACAQLR